LGGTTPAQDSRNAGEFTTSQAYVIGEIKGYMEEWTDGSVTAVIYNDDNSNTDIPGTERFTATFNIPVSDTFDWYGASGLNYNLPAGTYWVGFRMSTSSSFVGVMKRGAPTPLGNEASFNLGTNAWTPSDNLNFGFRIAAVPLPGALLLLGAGLLRLAAYRRRQQG
jgi:hypothetical protein